MYSHLQQESLDEPPTDRQQDHNPPEESREANHSLLAEDPLTGLAWTETLLPLITNWAGSSTIHAICLHFVGLGILANIPELQSSHSMLQEATKRLTPLIKDHDRLTRFSGNKLLIFSKRSEAGIRGLVVEVSDGLESFGVEAEGRRLPEIRIGMAAVGRGGAITVEAVNALMNDAVNITVPLSDVVAPRTSEVPPPTSRADLPPQEPMPRDVPPLHDQATLQGVPTPPDAPASPHASAHPLTPVPSVPAIATVSRVRHPQEEVSQSPETTEETSMITRGHLERTPIRHPVESPVPADGKPPSVSPHRLTLRGVDVVVTGLVATAVVDLEFEGQRVRGKAIGRSTDSHHMELIAEALGRAVTDLLPTGHGVVFKQAVPASTDAGDVVVTVVDLLTPEKAEVLFGVAPTESEPATGVARSVLSAVNHSLAHLLAPVE